jgi:hypothetical protein
MTLVHTSRREVDEFFAGHGESKILFEVLYAVVAAWVPVELRVTKSQIALSRDKAFARVWVPGKYLRGETAPLVLTLGFRHRDPSPRWKEIVEPYPGRFTHHLELYSASDIDEEVRNWLRGAWMTAG